VDATADEVAYPLRVHSLATHPAVVSALQPVRYEPEPAHRRPAASRLVLATVVAIVGSLLADWLLAKAGVALFPSTRGYQHFRFADYSKLTVVGVLAACIGWPLVVRFCRTPRWLYSRLAVVVTAVLLLPDVAIWIQGQPAKAVAVLVVMHLAIAVITYFAVVLLAPPRGALQAA
jgi:hypothetical protein